MKTLSSPLVAAIAILFAGCSISQNLILEDGEVSSGSFHTIDGNIVVGKDALLGSAKTIDGDISIAEGCSISKNVRAIDGDIDATGSKIGGKDAVRGGSAVRIDIGPGSSVRAIVVENESSNVQIRVHTTAIVGSVRGAEVESYGEDG